MKLRYYFFYFHILLLCFACNNAKTDVNPLLEDVARYNSAGNQDSSIYFLFDYLSQETKDTTGIIQAYIALSNTYKSIRNYDKAKNYLLAAEEYIPSFKKPEKISVSLLFEKALVLFDIQEYDDALNTMNIIKPYLYELDSTSQAQFIMQEGYLFYLKKDYEKALGIFDEALITMSECAPRHLPMIYPKKMQTYARMNDLDKVYEMRDSSMYYAKKHGIPLYELYTLEVLRDVLLEMKEFEVSMEVKEEARVLSEGINNEAKTNQIAQSEINTKIQIIETARKNIMIFRILILGMLLLLFTLIYYFMKNVSSRKKIEKQKKQLEELNNTKDQIFAILGHDLRKPVVAFRNVAKKVSYLIKKKDYSRIEQLGEDIERDSIGLNILTDNLLNWALREKKALPIRIGEIELSEIIYETTMSLMLLADDKKIEIKNEIQAGEYIYADRDTLLNIVRNILDNAIKFTPNKGIIRFFSKNVDNYNQIIIEDSGKGMSKDKIKEILSLEMNQSIDGTDGEKGTGLGLYLIQQLMELNKGIIEIESELDKGTRVILSFPKFKK